MMKNQKKKDMVITNVVVITNAMVITNVMVITNEIFKYLSNYCKKPKITIVFKRDDNIENESEMQALIKP